MKCKVCGGHAVIDVRRHNAAFCGEHFIEHTRNQVSRAIKEFRMFGTGDRLFSPNHVTQLTGRRRR